MNKESKEIMEKKNKNNVKVEESDQDDCNIIEERMQIECIDNTPYLTETSIHPEFISDNNKEVIGQLDRNDALTENFPGSYHDLLHKSSNNVFINNDHIINNNEININSMSNINPNNNIYIKPKAANSLTNNKRNQNNLPDQNTYKQPNVFSFPEDKSLQYNWPFNQKELIIIEEKQDVIKETLIQILTSRISINSHLNNINYQVSKSELISNSQKVLDILFTYATEKNEIIFNKNNYNGDLDFVDYKPQLLFLYNPRLLEITISYVSIIIKYLEKEIEVGVRIDNIIAENKSISNNNKDNKENKENNKMNIELNNSNITENDILSNLNNLNFHKRGDNNTLNITSNFYSCLENYLKLPEYSYFKNSSSEFLGKNNSNIKAKTFPQEKETPNSTSTTNFISNLIMTKKFPRYLELIPSLNCFFDLNSNSNPIQKLNDVKLLLEFEEILLNKISLPSNSIISSFVKSKALNFITNFVLPNKDFLENLNLIYNNDTNQPISQDLLNKPNYPINEPLEDILPYLNEDFKHEFVYASNVMKFLSFVVSIHPYLKAYLRKGLLERTFVVFDVNENGLIEEINSSYFKSNDSNEDECDSNSDSQGNNKVSDLDKKQLNEFSSFIKDKIPLQELENRLDYLANYYSYYGMSEETEMLKKNSNTEANDDTSNDDTFSYKFSFYECKYYFEKTLYFLDYDISHINVSKKKKYKNFEDSFNNSNTNDTDEINNSHMRENDNSNMEMDLEKGNLNPTNRLTCTEPNDNAFNVKIEISIEDAIFVLYDLFLAYNAIDYELTVQNDNNKNMTDVIDKNTEFFSSKSRCKWLFFRGLACKHAICDTLVEDYRVMIKNVLREKCDKIIVNLCLNNLRGLMVENAYLFNSSTHNNNSNIANYGFNGLNGSVLGNIENNNSNNVVVISLDEDSKYIYLKAFDCDKLSNYEKHLNIVNNNNNSNSNNNLSKNYLSYIQQELYINRQLLENNNNNNNSNTNNRLIIANEVLTKFIIGKNISETLKSFDLEEKKQYGLDLQRLNAFIIKTKPKAIFFSSKTNAINALYEKLQENFRLINYYFIDFNFICHFSSELEYKHVDLNNSISINSINSSSNKIFKPTEAEKVSEYLLPIIFSPRKFLLSIWRDEDFSNMIFNYKLHSLQTILSNEARMDLVKPIRSLMNTEYFYLEKSYYQGYGKDSGHSNVNNFNITYNLISKPINTTITPLLYPFTLNENLLLMIKLNNTSNTFNHKNKDKLFEYFTNSSLYIGKIVHKLLSRNENNSNTKMNLYYNSNCNIDFYCNSNNNSNNKSNAVLEYTRIKSIDKENLVIVVSDEKSILLNNSTYFQLIIQYIKLNRIFDYNLRDEFINNNNSSNNEPDNTNINTNKSVSPIIRLFAKSMSFVDMLKGAYYYCSSKSSITDNKDKDTINKIQKVYYNRKVQSINFYNITFKAALEKLKNLFTGEYLIRPSPLSILNNTNNNECCMENNNKVIKTKHNTLILSYKVNTINNLYWNILIKEVKNNNNDNNKIESELLFLPCSYKSFSSMSEIHDMFILKIKNIFYDIIRNRKCKINITSKKEIENTLRKEKMANNKTINYFYVLLVPGYVTLCFISNSGKIRYVNLLINEEGIHFYKLNSNNDDKQADLSLVEDYLNENNNESNETIISNSHLTIKPVDSYSSISEEDNVEVLSHQRHLRAKNIIKSFSFIEDFSNFFKSNYSKVFNNSISCNTALRKDIKKSYCYFSNCTENSINSNKDNLNNYYMLKNGYDELIPDEINFEFVDSEKNNDSINNNNKYAGDASFDKRKTNDGFNTTNTKNKDNGDAWGEEVVESHTNNKPSNDNDAWGANAEWGGIEKQIETHVNNNNTNNTNALNDWNIPVSSNNNNNEKETELKSTFSKFSDKNNTSYNRSEGNNYRGNNRDFNRNNNRDNNRERNENSTTCNYCKEEGHIIKDCPKKKPKMCNYCKEEGHFIRDCPKKKDRGEGGFGNNRGGDNKDYLNKKRFNNRDQDNNSNGRSFKKDWNSNNNIIDNNVINDQGWGSISNNINDNNNIELKESDDWGSGNVAVNNNSDAHNNADSWGDNPMKVHDTDNKKKSTDSWGDDGFKEPLKVNNSKAFDDWGATEISSNNKESNNISNNNSNMNYSNSQAWDQMFTSTNKTNDFSLKSNKPYNNHNDSSNSYFKKDRSNNKSFNRYDNNNNNNDNDNDYNKREKRPPMKCFNCDTEGHRASDCPDPKKPRVTKCFKCDKEGHRANECTESQKPRGVLKCFNCDTEGHRASDCPDPKKPRVTKCFKCNQEGHRANECTESSGGQGFGGGFRNNNKYDGDKYSKKSYEGKGDWKENKSYDRNKRSDFNAKNNFDNKSRWNNNNEYSNNKNENTQNKASNDNDSWGSFKNDNNINKEEGEVDKKTLDDFKKNKSTSKNKYSKNNNDDDDWDAPITSNGNNNNKNDDDW